MQTVTIKNRTYEVVSQSDMTKLPAMSTYMSGIYQLRGKRGGVFELTIHRNGFWRLMDSGFRDVATGHGQPPIIMTDGQPTLRLVA